jgi:hypothetical protein
MERLELVIYDAWGLTRTLRSTRRLFAKSTPEGEHARRQRALWRGVASGGSGA